MVKYNRKLHLLSHIFNWLSRTDWNARIRNLFSE